MQNWILEKFPEILFDFITGSTGRLFANSYISVNSD